MIRRTRIKAKRSTPRRGQLRDTGYVRWLHWQRCILGTNSCVSPACSSFYGEGVHTQNNGMRSKGPDSSRAPLCRQHHVEYDAGRKAFEKKYGVDMKAIAAEYWQRYQQEKAAAQAIMGVGNNA